MGDVCEVYYFVVFVGYGVEVIYFYFVFEMIIDFYMLILGMFDFIEVIFEKVIYNYVKVIGKGLSKIMFKMGVSIYFSYCGV